MLLMHHCTDDVPLLMHCCNAVVFLMLLHCTAALVYVLIPGSPNAVAVKWHKCGGFAQLTMVVSSCVSAIGVHIIVSPIL